MIRVQGEIGGHPGRKVIFIGGGRAFPVAAAIEGQPGYRGVLQIAEHPALVVAAATVEVGGRAVGVLSVADPGDQFQIVAEQPRVLKLELQARVLGIGVDPGGQGRAQNQVPVGVRWKTGIPVGGIEHVEAVAQAG